jgi:hypothetical protein
MARWLFMVALWLAAFAGVARADDFRRNDDAKVVHFHPPKEYCALPVTNAAYQPLVDHIQAISNVTLVQAIYMACSRAKTGGLPSDTIVYLAFVRDDHARRQAGAVSNSARAQWLMDYSRELTNKTAGTDSIDMVVNGEVQTRTVRLLMADDTLPRNAQTPYEDAKGRNHVDVLTEGLTVAADTPVIIGLHRTLNADDWLELGVTLDQLRPVSQALVRRFALDNGFALDRVPTPDQARDAAMLGGVMVLFGLGSIILLATAVRRFWVQAPLAAGIVVIAILIYRAAPSADLVSWRTYATSVAEIAAAFVVLGLANGVLALLQRVKVRGASITDRILRIASTRLWQTSADTAPAVGDFTKRWFVTVSAATGSVVFAVLFQPDFAAELVRSISGSRIVFTLRITVVSVTLIGPVEEYIFESRIVQAHGPPAGHDQQSRFEDMIQLMSPKALGRFALVLVFMMQLTIVHGALEARIHEGDPKASLIMLVASVGPAIITYYWCAALQRGAVSVARTTAQAAALAGFALITLPILLVVFPRFIYLAVTSSDAPSATEWGLLVLALVFGVCSFSALAYGGGRVIDEARRRAMPPAITIGLIAAILALIVAGYLGIWNTLRLHAMHEKMSGNDRLDTLSAVMAMAGWSLGLLVSGFPSVLRHGATLGPNAPRTVAPSDAEPSHPRTRPF